MMLGLISMNVCGYTDTFINMLDRPMINILFILKCHVFSINSDVLDLLKEVMPLQTKCSRQKEKFSSSWRKPL